MNQKPILFSENLTQLVIEGIKTQTRRPMKSEEPQYTVGFRWCPAVDVVCEITGIRSELLSDISDDDAILEGEDSNRITKYCSGADLFCSTWDDFHGESEFEWDNAPMVWVYDFVVISK